MTSMRRHFPVLFSVITAAVLILTACAPSASQAPAPLATAVPVTGPTSAPPSAPTSAIPEGLTPSVKVSDQAISNGTVTVEQVTSPGPGWIVIHVNSSGAPGPIIGWAQVKTGVNNNVPVTIDTSKATPVLYAMLHTDAGAVGTYEFPGPDTPVMLNGQMVSPAFGVTGGGGAAPAAETAAPSAEAPTAPAAPATPSAGGYGGGSPTATAGSSAPSASTAATVNIGSSAKLGTILVDSKGMTLYIFKKDAPGVSNCTGGCAENWPPLLIPSGNPAAGGGVNGKLGSIQRSDNGTQVTYNNQPLYTFAGDKAPGDVNGQGIANSWFAATP